MKYVMTPYSSRSYITPNKLYKFTPDERMSTYGYIKDDKGYKLFISLKSCAYLDDRPWTLVEEPKQAENKGLWNAIKKFLKK